MPLYIHLFFSSYYFLILFYKSICSQKIGDLAAAKITRLSSIRKKIILGLCSFVLFFSTMNKPEVGFLKIQFLSGMIDTITYSLFCEFWQLPCWVVLLSLRMIKTLLLTVIYCSTYFFSTCWNLHKCIQFF